LPFVPLTQEAKAKQRKVCPVNLRGEVCMANNCGNKHPKVCIVADHGKGKIPKATCALWHMRVLFAGKTQGNFTQRRSGPNPPPSSRGSNSSNAKVRPAKPDKYLIKLKAKANAEELKTRMLQGVTYSQVVGGPVVPPQAPAHVAPRSSSCTSQQQQARPALTPDGAIAILEEAIWRLRILPQQ
jgi:hypothetical protein